MKSSDFFKITPYGGWGEIGSNMTVIETEEDFIVIDYGIIFPQEESFGIDYLIPNLKQIKTEKKINLIITHCHEDHIGGIAYFVNFFPESQIYISEFNKYLLIQKIKRRNTLPANINVYQRFEALNFSNISIKPFAVNHSIPNTDGLLINISLKNNLTYQLIFASDFKVDSNPYAENPFPFQWLTSELNNQHKKISLLDSTNILNKGKTPSESDLSIDLEKLIAKENRLFITFFPSNLFRFSQIFSLALKFNKKIILIGRSMIDFFEAAKQTNFFPAEWNYFTPEQVKNLASPDNLFLITGCQGDFFSALRRIANKEQKGIEINQKDSFIFSSKIIPGNEKKVNKLYNKISEQGGEIITDKDYLIHASGHASQEDLKMFYNIIKPDYAIPIHGESYFLKKHVDFIEKNYPKTKAILTYNNNDILFTAKSSEYIISKSEISDNNLIEPMTIICGDLNEISKDRIREKRKIAENGLIILLINISQKNNNLKSVQIELIGLPDEMLSHQNKCLELITDFVNFNKNLSIEKYKEESKNILKRYGNLILNFRPEVKVIVIES